MSNKWQPQEERLLRMLRPTNTNAEITVEFKKQFDANVPGFENERTEEAIRRKCNRDNITAETAVKHSSAISRYKARLKELEELQQQYASEHEERSIGILDKDTTKRKIVSISDIHLPFARLDLIDQIFTEHKDADILIMNGDIMEQMDWSMYPKTRRINALIEYILAFKLVSMARRIFPQVILVNGNHDARPARTLKAEGVSAERTDILRPDLLARIANGEELDETGMLIKKHNWDNVYYQQQESWYVKVGKTLFVHPWSKGSIQPGFTVKAVNEYMAARYQTDEYDSIIVGHTHKLYKGVINSKLLIEQGCLAGLMAYAHSPRLQYKSANGMNGFAVVYQDENGNTDFNDSNFIFLGEVLPPKKDVML